ncbi:hypothetical protein K438DRAFT_1556989, partial [Mycena galopus ATCC 62051]
PNITISLVDRINIAGAGIETAISKLGPDAQSIKLRDAGQSLGYAGQLYSQMAEFDIASNQTKYKDTLKEYFLKAPHRSSNFSDVYAYGHAGAIAYAAYGDRVFLDYAIQSWSFGQTYTLTPQQVAVGKTDIKNFTIISHCQDITMAGGTFYASPCSLQLALSHVCPVCRAMSRTQQPWEPLRLGECVMLPARYP